jgi:hypothetical protein
MYRIIFVCASAGLYAIATDIKIKSYLFPTVESYIQNYHHIFQGKSISIRLDIRAFGNLM